MRGSMLALGRDWLTPNENDDDHDAMVCLFVLKIVVRKSDPVDVESMMMIWRRSSKKGFSDCILGGSQGDGRSQEGIQHCYQIRDDFGELLSYAV